ncbi:hypothetical protein CYY_004389 [Polysphondylium violaceum]|uniref:Peptidase A1 domain-containing protein n=1 Tax=Polysphondylium violaceum TaxID=133409 RepID=A0A8J4UZ94_9MYCE|nr:hypothetical protein CYY_004389 [Polysphondylium violaceum]
MNLLSKLFVLVVLVIYIFGNVSSFVLVNKRLEFDIQKVDKTKDYGEHLIPKLPLVPIQYRDQEDLSKSLQLDIPSDSIPFSGSEFGIVVTIKLNNVTQTLLFDTGSTLVIVPEKRCKSCTEFKTQFYEKGVDTETLKCYSETCNNTKTLPILCGGIDKDICTFQITYSDGTKYICEMMNDYISILENKIPFVFGSIIADIGKQLPNSYGILGVGRPCPTCPPTISDNISKYFNIPNILGVRINENYQGKVTIGDPFINGNHEKLSYTPMDSKRSYGYYVNPTKIEITKISNRSLILDSQELALHYFLVDTGSSLTYFSPEIYDRTVRFIRYNCFIDFKCHNIYENCFLISVDRFQLFPTIRITFKDNVTLEIPPEVYFTKIINGVHCIGIMRGATPNKSIIGLSFMRNNYIIFDKENQRIGFVEKL